jgi:cytochrome c oxidase subunit 3
MAQTHDDPNVYYVPHHSPWPFFGSITLFSAMLGVANWFNGHAWGQPLFLLGLVATLAVLFAWFGNVISESLAGRYNPQVDTSFRMGMMWFIFSEVMFFSAFFGARFYARMFTLPWLSGEGDGALTNQFIWPGYSAGWPTNGPAAIGGDFQTIPAWGLPLINTLILLSSGVTITIAHHALRSGNRAVLNIFLGATFLLGYAFVYLQATEYIHAYHELGLTLSTGIYGATFFMLTGFHGLHVTVGAIMLTVIWGRTMRGHFTPQRHFGFEAVAWYWHFVDVVWLILFVFVYWL